MRPRIGITTYARTDEMRPAFAVPCSYIDAVVTAGGVPILLPPLAAAGEFLGVIDGLIVPGGGDIAPETYGGDAHEHHYDVSPERDDAEVELLRAALDVDHLPILCICRGMQVLNVALGGNLVPHLPDVVGDAVPHRAPQLQPVEHAVTLRRGTRTQTLHGVETMPVQSIHHQAVDRMGDGLVPTAYSPDDVLEGVELPGRAFVLGVQWHPELSPQEATARRIFDVLVEHAASR